MDRRELLGSFAAIGALGVAGCSSAPTPGGGGDDGDGGDGSGKDDSDGSGSDGGDGSGSDGGGGSDSTDGDGNSSDDDGSEDAELYIAQAVSTLNAVALRLNKVKDKLDTPEEIDLDQQTLLGGIEESRGQLDSASETASETQLAQIETLRNLAVVLEEMTLVVGVVVEVDPDAAAEETKTAVENENYDEALSVVRDAKAKATTIQERTTTAENALEGVNADRLKEVDGVEYAKVESAVVETAALADGFETLTVGYEASILGAQDLETGRDHTESKDYEKAKASFGDAKTHFAAANETFECGCGETTDDLDVRIEVASCQTTHLQKAAVAFEKGAEDAEDGNPLLAKEHRDDGEAQLEKVDECGQN